MVIKREMSLDSEVFEVLSCVEESRGDGSISVFERKIGTIRGKKVCVQVCVCVFSSLPPCHYLGLL